MNDEKQPRKKQKEIAAKKAAKAAGTGHRQTTRGRGGASSKTRSTTASDVQCAAPVLAPELTSTAPFWHHQMEPQNIRIQLERKSMENHNWYRWSIIELEFVTFK